MEKVTDQLGIFRTRTEGYDPKANGKAERYIGLLKHDAAMKLLETKNAYYSMVLGNAASIN